MSKLEEKQELIESIGIQMEQRLNVSPLAARIYALLALSSYEGLSFDTIRNSIGSSKSSTSVNLNVLIQLKYVEYRTKSGDRKRYFRVAKYFQISALEQQSQTLATDIKMVEKINDFNKNHYPEKFDNEQSLGQLTIDYLLKMQSLVKNTIDQLKKLS
ncbi:MarR family transcriptional regulator [Subsaximicrobium wynnwilliamsii]|jgi:DNA-binding transcriptional regulator GbsR (MarR family)|uniref:MarR family transcriptional regulator n=1 Tax=Subsaximicrobium wynnwilliamsii TaxID=291179 RepID=A0A5C6ZIP2_9FLAO|nr:MarR family transcriptional regulator [Subsaximicrobium wynnwilliamsii]TXD84397.1 MarR family transcriptional regulator [Subsaximicrobium wynnwilliamsii]TXD90078.1 MarR family transcriptional regulator [Subsaximicrobium wynnwilliamsii]TXE04130.1 MarR family transcriptional regulator [Subsaximicrobium wynnwilliamsii]